MTLAYLAMLCPAGCAIFSPIAPGQDKPLVLAERGYQASFETVNALLKLEKDNQPFVVDHLPALHQFCQDIRVDAQQSDGGVFGAAERAIGLYREIKKTGPADPADMNARLKVVSELAARAKAYLAEAHGKGLH